VATGEENPQRELRVGGGRHGRFDVVESFSSGGAMLKVDHDRCTECRMCYIVCRELDINAVYVAHEPLHRIEIDPQACTYPGCTACLMYCPAAGSIVELETGRSMVPPPPEAWQT
jgi:MinD superfamily P-loop ATPase